MMIIFVAVIENIGIMWRDSKGTKGKLKSTLSMK